MTLLRIAEAATEGHPDSVADIVADTVLDSYLQQDSQAKVACEVFLAKNLVVIGGEFTSYAEVDLDMVVRKAIRDIGYTSSEIGFSADDCRVVLSISGQSASLQRAVDFGQAKAIGAGDQAVVIGFAERNDTGMIPVETYYARKLATMLGDLRRSGELDYLRPDGKVLIGFADPSSGSWELNTLCISAQHSPNIDKSRVARELLERVSRCIPSEFISSRTQIFVNPPNGMFCEGGPAADTGLTGRKTISSTYGPRVGGGGGALSGKDPTKIDRCAAYGARYVAKQLIHSGVADEVIVQLTYVLGRAEPVSVSVQGRSSGSNLLLDLTDATRAKFDLRPGAFIEGLALCRPIYARCARSGHFGIDSTLPWEAVGSPDI